MAALDDEFLAACEAELAQRQLQQEELQEQQQQLDEFQEEEQQQAEDQQQVEQQEEPNEGVNTATAPTSGDNGKAATAGQPPAPISPPTSCNTQPGVQALAAVRAEHCAALEGVGPALEGAAMRRVQERAAERRDWLERLSRGRAAQVRTGPVDRDAPCSLTTHSGWRHPARLPRLLQPFHAYPHGDQAPILSPHLYHSTQAVMLVQRHEAELAKLAGQPLVVTQGAKESTAPAEAA